MRQKELTAWQFFTFPSPVDSIESRLHAFLCLVVAVFAGLLSALLDFHWVWLYLVYGFFARTLFGPRLDPQVCRFPTSLLFPAPLCC